MRRCRSYLLCAATAVLSLWIFGCGSSSRDVAVTDNGAVPRSSAFRLRLEPGDLSEATTEIGFMAFDSAGKVVMESYLAPSARVDLERVPGEAVDMAVLLLSDRHIEKVGVFRLAGAGVSNQSPGASAFKSPAQAFVAFSLNQQSLDLETGDVAVLKAHGVLANGQTIDVTDSVSWRVEDPEVAEVVMGVVDEHSPGETTVHASFGGSRAQVRLKVVDRDFPTFQSRLGGGTLDLEAGTLDGRAIAGWDPEKKTIKAVGVLLTGDFHFINGDTLAVGCLNADIEDVSITGSDGSKGPRLAVGGANIRVSNFSSRSGTSSGSNLPSGDLILGAARVQLDGNIDLQGSDTITGAPAGRPGGLVARGVDVFVNGPIDVSGASGLQGSTAGFVSIFGASQLKFSNQGQLTANGGNAQEQGPGGLGGVISLSTRLTIDGGNLDLLCTANGGNGAPNDSDESAAGGDGGKIILIGRQNNSVIESIQHVIANGGDATAGQGGRGGSITALSAGSETSVAQVTAAGGSSTLGPGGEGGTISFPNSGTNIYEVPGGAGNPNGSEGQIVVGKNDLVIESGEHVFNTDNGQLDGVVPVGWNPLDLTLNATSLQIDQGATLSVQGSNPFLASLQDDAVIDGALVFDEGTIEISGDSLDLSGRITTNGLPTNNEVGGDGGLIQLSFSSLSILGQIASLGGESSNNTSGNGGDIQLSALSTLSLSGIIDASGARGFNAAGHGGSISVESDGDLQATGSFSCLGGEGAVGGKGGNIILSAVSAMALSTIDCNGGESTRSPSDGGSVQISGQGDITLNGNVTVNSGNLFTPSQAGGDGGTVEIDGDRTVTVLAKVLANGVSPGVGGRITINGALGVVASLADVLALPGGTVTITP